jgi:hypothetical protein
MAVVENVQVCLNRLNFTHSLTRRVQPSELWTNQSSDRAGEHEFAEFERVKRASCLGKFSRWVNEFYMNNELVRRGAASGKMRGRKKWKERTTKGRDAT